MEVWEESLNGTIGSAPADEDDDVVDEALASNLTELEEEPAEVAEEAPLAASLPTLSSPLDDDDDDGDEEYDDDFEDDFSPRSVRWPCASGAALICCSQLLLTRSQVGTPVTAARASAPPEDALPEPPEPSVPPEPPEPPRATAVPPWVVIRLNELDVGDELARGASGVVHSAAWRGRDVAVKRLTDTSSAQLALAEAELFVHAELRHDAVVRLLGANLVMPDCCIVMERCACSLFERLHRQRRELDRRRLVTIAAHVADGLAYLHSRSPPLVHRDVKSLNVLLTEAEDAKLCDFGLVNAKVVTAGTPHYMAPELLLAKSYSTPVDAYAFGVLLNEMFAREVPWDGYTYADIKPRVVAGDRPEIARTMPTVCVSLVRKAWHANAALRPTLASMGPTLAVVLETLPLNSLSTGRQRDALDALDSLML